MKLQAKEFFDEKLENVGLIVGTPCSFFKGFQNEAINRGMWINTANEGSAVALATGYNMMQNGTQCLTIFQSSGIGNAISPLTSLNYPFEQAINILVSHRTEEPGEDQHKLMAHIDKDLLKLCKLDTYDLNENSFIEEPDSMPYGSLSKAYLVPKGAFEMVELEKKEVTKSKLLTRPIYKEYTDFNQGLYEPLSRYEAIRDIVNFLENQNEPYIIIGTTGMTGRELFAIKDSEHNLYLRGSMGHASSLGLGMAIARPDIKIIVIDGDAALQMHMGNMTTIGAINPNNLIHVLLDNHLNDTTGGQETNCDTAWDEVAKSCGYNKVFTSRYTDIALDRAFNSDLNGATFIYTQIKPGSEKVGRPNMKPVDEIKRMQEYVKSIK